MKCTVLTICLLSIIICFSSKLISQTDSTAYKPKIFSFDRNTREVKGAYFLKLEKLIDRRTDSLEDLKIRNTSAHVLQKINKGRPKNKRFGGVDPSPNGKFYYSLDGDSYGYTKVNFFTSEGKYLKSHKIDPPVYGGVCYNADGNYLMVYCIVQPYYYFFTASGELVRKGDYNEFTGDYGANYGKPNISKTGRYWLLSNRLTFLYDSSSSLIEEREASDCSYLDEDKQVLIYTLGNWIKVYNFRLKRIEFLAEVKKNWLLSIEGKYLNIKFSKNGPMYRYSIQY